VSDEHPVFPEQQSANAKEPVTARDRAPETPADGIGDDAANRGRRAGVTAAGEAVGSGSAAGGGGSPEDYDSDPVAGGGAVRYTPDRDRPVEGADAPASGSA